MTLRILSFPSAHCFEALAYDIPFEPCFEPYVVVDKTVTPLYDERFRGYGMNKVGFFKVGCFFMSVRQMQTPANVSTSSLCTFGMRGGAYRPVVLLWTVLALGFSPPCFSPQR